MEEDLFRANDHSRHRYLSLNHQGLEDGLIDGDQHCPVDAQGFVDPGNH